MVKPSSADRRFARAITLIVVAALVLRLTRIGSNSFWVDEINVLSFVRSGHLLSELRSRGGPFESPLHYVIIWVASYLPFGFETCARVPAAGFGAVEVLGIGLLVRRLTARRDVALLASAILAVAPFAVRYSQEARYYTTFSALHLVSWWLLVRAFQLRTRASFLWWGVGTAALILAHPFSPLVVIVQLSVIGVLARRAHRRGEIRGAREVVQDAFRACVLAGLIVLPWYLWGMFRWVPDLIDGRSYQLNPGTREQVTLSFDLVVRVAQSLLANGGRWTFLSLFVVLMAVGSVTCSRGRCRRVALAMSLYTVGFLVALVPMAHVLNTYFAMRRIEFLLPPTIGVAAIGICAVSDRVRERWPMHVVGRQVQTALISAVLGLSLIAVVVYFTTEKTNYRALAAVIAGTPSPDVIVVGPVDYRWPPAIVSYLAWRGVHRDLRFIVSGRKLPRLPGRPGRVVWVTGSRPGGHGFRTRALNSVPDLQVIAGDRTSPGAVLPWFVSTSSPSTSGELKKQLDEISRVAVLLNAPDSHLPWSLFTGR